MQEASGQLTVLVLAAADAMYVCWQICVQQLVNIQMYAVCSSVEGMDETEAS